MIPRTFLRSRRRCASWSQPARPELGARSPTCSSPVRAEVHICDVADEFLIDYRAAHPSAGVTRADVSSEADVERLFDDVKASLGGLDALINNAGIAGPTGGVEEIKPEDWRRTIDVCLTGQFLCAHFAVPIAQSCGRRFDRQFFLGCGAVRLRISDTVLGCQIWGYRVDPEPRQGARTR